MTGTTPPPDPTTPPPPAAEAFGLTPMTALDVDEVLALEHRLFPQDAWPESFFYDELAHTASGPGVEPTRRYWVARDAGGRLSGYAGMMCVLPLADVQTLAVAPESQGHGLGTRLLRLLVSSAREQSAEQILLEVRSDNPGAQALYRREGFSHIHTRAQYYPDGEDALIMAKPLIDLTAPSSAADLRSPFT
ncbi:ribosomal protein S18-alanine N-acetyltransferase [Nesterenkonia aurantiaca]|uniref:ribosomal protein S18-alanine N-acetyltransferase n=1 Tax=Nesterenkonia aurantiaca TaxID=1436010 RepID=UPI003EE7A14A